MKKSSLILAALLAIPFGNAKAAGDPDAGMTKAGACTGCHGDKNWPGVFFTLQLAGRDADKLTIKTNKYRTFKIINPIMNLVVMGLKDQDVEDISAYYHSLGEPAFVNPLFPIKGDDDEPAAAPAPAGEAQPASQ
jgi:cytochrome c553